MRQVHRVLKKHGTFWCCIGDKYVSEIDILAKRIGFHKRSHVIWFFTFGVHQKKNFSPSHTHLLYYTRHPKTFTFNTKEIRVPSARQLIYNDKRANPDGKVPDNTWILRPQDLGDEGFASGADVWHVPRINGTFKERIPGAPNQMPEQLIARIVLACSNVGDVVLDPFAGTATIAAVAKKLGRNYIAYEISEKWAKIGNDRLEKIALPGFRWVGDAVAGETAHGEGDYGKV